MTRRPPYLIAHVIFRLHVGGLENGLVNLINGLPSRDFRHVIICIDDFTDFRKRIQRDDVEIHAIHKKSGTDLSALWRLYKILRKLRPDILHTRNLAALDALLPALLAGVHYRIHGEHGRDIDDIDGKNRKLQLLRKLHRPLVHKYIALSQDLAEYLNSKVGVATDRIVQIYNGVDTKVFHPLSNQDDACSDLAHWHRTGKTIVGTVGRLESVKDQMNLVRAFNILIDKHPALRETVRLVIVGDGSAREEIESELGNSTSKDLVWLPGSRDDIPDILRSLNLFVLSSLAEGISNTILEAMASGVAVVATDVGGNRELVVSGETGQLVAPADPDVLCDAIATYIFNDRLRQKHGEAGRERALRKFSIERMTEQYGCVYGKQ